MSQKILPQFKTLIMKFLLRKFQKIVSKNFSKLFQYKEVDEQFSQFTPKQLKSKKEFNIDKMVAEGVFKPASKGIPITIKGVLPNEPKRPEWMKVKANLGK